MSTATAEPPTAIAEPELRTYRGRTLEELLPKIREELGADAIVVRQRDGLMGGIGGFFQQRFVEIEARRGHPRVDVYDEPPAIEDFAAQLAAAEERASEPLVSAAPFADALLSAAAQSSAPTPAPEPTPPGATLPPPAAVPPEPSAPATAASEPTAATPPLADFASALPVAPRAEPEPSASALTASAGEPPELAEPRASAAIAPGPVAATPEPASASTGRRASAPPEAAANDTERADLIATLVDHGVSESFARELVADATTHLLPLLPEPDARVAVATALARRILLAPLPAAAGRCVAFAGAAGTGKTRCTAALAAAHAQAGGQPVRVLALDPDDGGAELTRLLAPHGVEVEPVATPSAAGAALEQALPGALVVLDTPAVSPGDSDGIARLAGRLARIGLDETHIVLPATLSAAVAREQLERLAPLRPGAIALTHADATDHVGALVELACTTALPFAYVADGRALPGGLRHADAAELAERLLR
jgi:flagellar biosynthesis GTPase FlhF